MLIGIDKDMAKLMIMNWGTIKRSIKNNKKSISTFPAFQEICSLAEYIETHEWTEWQRRGTDRPIGSQIVVVELFAGNQTVQREDVLSLPMKRKRRQ